VGRRLVEHHDIGRLQEEPRNRDSLLLAAREPIAAIPDDRVEAFGQRLDERQDLGRAQDLEQLGVARARPRAEKAVDAADEPPCYASRNWRAAAWERERERERAGERPSGTTGRRSI
jgi:hypothetical protein